MNDPTHRNMPSLLPPVVTMLAEVPLASYTLRECVQSPEEAFEVVQPLLQGLDREVGLIVSLDTKHRVLAVDTLSIGSVGHTFFSPREVFRTILARGASAFYVAHNHPSGDPTPSADDRAITKRLSSGGVLLNVELLDHIVVGDAGFDSLARSGVI
jgi:DNA repair protein RadC